jgi:hypothetical protein
VRSLSRPSFLPLGQQAPALIPMDAEGVDEDTDDEDDDDDDEDDSEEYTDEEDDDEAVMAAAVAHRKSTVRQAALPVHA